MRPTSSTWRTAALLFCSGACALIYQTVWMRDFRLIFGVSTLATGAVLAIFMGGLGLGSALLGRRADKDPHPLALYGKLEIGIAISAALSPFLLMLVRAAYIGAGGAASLGNVAATLIRLALSALVLAIPTILMGGTLPAAARAVESNDDAGRRRLALLYGINTLGAVTGALLSTFVLLERFGNRSTLFVAAIVNLAVGAYAFVAGRKQTIEQIAEAPVAPAKKQKEQPAKGPALPPRVVLIAAALVGFAFLLMELVWYRMLSPILGGTTFMFGLVLAVALAGIGIGGAAYSFGRSERVASAAGFAVTCTLEALAMIVPFAMGDRIALLANRLRAGIETFGGHVWSWAIVTMIVALPAAIIAGFQFPLLISLLGRGREGVGRETGLAYAWNTGGSIAASLLGGFVLLPTLGAIGSWKLATFALIALGIVALYYSLRERKQLAIAVSAAATVAAIACMFMLGPTALWRHSGIGAGRAPQPADANATKDWVHAVRRTLVLDADGQESSIALISGDDLGLYVNGKSDGSARTDSGTQVMSGMIGALVHPNATRTLVVGLGTGTTSGWLAKIPSMEKVDVIELEQIVVDVADEFATVNHDCNNNPKHKTVVADAREVLQTTAEKYDLIFSEPSNPYRAGIASLYTREFYRSAAERLNPGGIFIQWMQMYAVDETTVRTIFATLGTTFPHIEAWTTTHGDVVLTASKQPIVFDANLIRRRLQQEPYRSAVHLSWRVETVEGILSYFLANENVAKTMGSQAKVLNTDDRVVIEFSFARTLARGDFDMEKMAAVSGRLNGTRPARIKGNIDWNAVAANRASIWWLPSPDPRHAFVTAYNAQDFGSAFTQYRQRPWEPVNTLQTAMVAQVLALGADPSAERHIEALRQWQPIEADAILGILRWRQNRFPESAQLLQSAFHRYRENPWPLSRVMDSGITALLQMSRLKSIGPIVLDSLSQRFAAYQLDEARRTTYLLAAYQSARCGTPTLASLQEFEPNIPWNQSALEIRSACYSQAGLALADQAKADLEAFARNSGS
jgi:spermidine synthase